MKSLLLPPLGVLYGAVTRARLSLYRRGTFQSARLGRPVISVGNITTGGTGKSPLVEWVVKTLAAQDKKVCILTRGYGRDHPERLVVVSDGERVLASPADAGDEPFLLATNLLGTAAVISSADRWAAGKKAIELFGVDCFVLDDGFQHLRLARDLNIVTIDATNPWGGGHLLPYGRLREPRKGLSRADCVVITRCDQMESLDELRAELVSLIGQRPLFESRMQTKRVVPLKNPPETISPVQPVAAFCAVGNPQSFFNHLKRDGYDVVLQKDFWDHHVYSQKEIDSLIDGAKAAGANSLITTAKDAVKLQSKSFSMPCYVLEIEPRIENAEALARLVLNATCGS
jgi:tetraacyldisaccharide 4'-kinase